MVIIWPEMGFRLLVYVNATNKVARQRIFTADAEAQRNQFASAPGGVGTPAGGLRKKAT